VPSYQQPLVAKSGVLPTPPPGFPFFSSSTSSKSGASRNAEGDYEGAQGGVVETGLLPVAKKTPKGLKTDVTKLRLGGGQVWQDHSLEDWDPSEYRDGHTPSISELYITHGVYSRNRKNKCVQSWKCEVSTPES
jgi:hypothetical protein